MAEDPVGGLTGTFPILELRKHVDAETVAIRTLSKSWVVRFSESWCLVGEYYYNYHVFKVNSRPVHEDERVTEILAHRLRDFRPSSRLEP